MGCCAEMQGILPQNPPRQSTPAVRPDMHHPFYSGQQRGHTWEQGCLQGCRPLAVGTLGSAVRGAEASLPACCQQRRSACLSNSASRRREPWLTGGAGFPCSTWDSRGVPSASIEGEEPPGSRPLGRPAGVRHPAPTPPPAGALYCWNGFKLMPAGGFQGWMGPGGSAPIPSRSACVWSGVCGGSCWAGRGRLGWVRLAALCSRRRVPYNY